MGIRVIVCGGRDYSDRAALFNILDRIHVRYPIAVIVEGGATGADDLAAVWARKRGVPIEEHKAAWSVHGKMAGRVRNGQMARLGAHLCVAFPGGAGTAHMVEVARRHGIKVWQPLGPGMWPYKD
jgi:hypothetical protein